MTQTRPKVVLAPQVVVVVIPTERYGFGSRDPIVFKTTEHADEFIDHATAADELSGAKPMTYTKHFCIVQSKKDSKSDAEIVQEKQKG